MASYLNGSTPAHLVVLSNQLSDLEGIPCKVSEATLGQTAKIGRAY